MSPLIPVGSVDPLQALEASGRAAAWLASVLNSRRGKPERGAALLLRELGVLAISGHALNNAARAVSAALLRYESTFDDDEVRRVFDEIDAFLNDALLVPEMERSLAALRRLEIMIHDGSLPLNIHVADAAGDLSDLLAISQVSRRWGVCSDLFERRAWSDRRLSQLWERLKQISASHQATGASVQAPGRISDLALDIRSPVPTEWLMRVDSRLGAVRVAMGIQHPRLPPPDWLYRNSLPASAGGD